jgi:rubrerythrin
MDTILMGAIASSIAIKNRNLGFYRAVAAKVSDSSTRKVFDTLTEEENRHLESLCDLYQGEENELVDILNRNDIFSDPYYCSLLNSIGGVNAESDALRIALRQEQSCIEWFTVFADIIRAPHIRDVFARVLKETNQRGDMIEKERARLTDLNRLHNQHKTIPNEAALHELSM